MHDNPKESTDALMAFTAAIKAELKKPAGSGAVMSLEQVEAGSMLGKLLLAATMGAMPAANGLVSMPGGAAPDPISLPRIDPKLVSRWIRCRLDSVAGMNSHAAPGAIPFLSHLADALDVAPQIGNWLGVSVATLVVVHALGSDEMQCYDAFEGRWIVAHSNMINAKLAEMRKTVDGAESSAMTRRPGWFGRVVRAIFGRD